MAERRSLLRDTKTLERPPPWLLESRSSTGFILLTICMSIFTDGFLYGFLVPVLPYTLTQRSHVPPEHVPYWTSLLFSVFGGAILAGSPIFGWLADRNPSRRWSLLIGLGFLALATVMFACGRSLWVLCTSRVLQGLSAANVYTSGLALLVDTVGRDDVGQMMGWALTSAHVGVLISPLIGGLVYTRAGYYPLFAMALALISIDILLRLAMIEKKVAARYLLGAKIDRYGTFQNGQSAGTETSPPPPYQRIPEGESVDDIDAPCPVYRPTEQRSPPPSGGARPGLFRRVTNRKAKFKLKKPTIFILIRSPRLLTAMLGIFVEVGIMSSFDTVLPLLVKQTFGWDPLQCGMLFLCIAAPSLTGPLVGKLSDRYGPRWIAVVGFLAAVPFLILLESITDPGTAKVVLLCVLLALIGLFLALVMPPLAADLAYMVQAKEAEEPGIFGPFGAYAQAFALFNCAMAAGMLVFPMWAGYSVARFGLPTLAWSLGIICGITAIPVILFTGARTKAVKMSATESTPNGDPDSV